MLCPCISFVCFSFHSCPCIFIRSSACTAHASLANQQTNWNQEMLQTGICFMISPRSCEGVMLEYAYGGKLQADRVYYLSFLHVGLTSNTPASNSQEATKINIIMELEPKSHSRLPLVPWQLCCSQSYPKITKEVGMTLGRFCLWLVICVLLLWYCFPEQTLASNPTPCELHEP